MPRLHPAVVARGAWGPRRNGPAKSTPRNRSAETTARLKISSCHTVSCPETVAQAPDKSDQTTRWGTPGQKARR